MSSHVIESGDRVTPLKIFIHLNCCKILLIPAPKLTLLQINPANDIHETPNYLYSQLFLYKATFHLLHVHT